MKVRAVRALIQVIQVTQVSQTQMILSPKTDLELCKKDHHRSKGKLFFQQINVHCQLNLLRQLRMMM